MRVFVTGATGFIGSAVVRELLAHGHEVSGLARSDGSAAALAASGVTPRRGSIEDLGSLERAAASADAAVHTAYFHQFSHASLRTRAQTLFGGGPRQVVSRFLAATVAADRRAITTIGSALKGSDRAFVAAFGTLALTPGAVGTEHQEVDPLSVGAGRGANEQAVLALAERGVRASVVRLPSIVHGEGDHGFLPRIIGVARKHKVSGFAGDGSNRWPSVHRLDAAQLFVRALEKGEAGARFHGVADEGVPFIDIAAAIGAHLEVPVQGATPKQVAARFSFLAAFLGVDNPTSSALTSSRLGWQPSRPSLLEDLQHGTYFGSEH